MMKANKTKLKIYVSIVLRTTVEWRWSGVSEACFRGAGGGGVRSRQNRQSLQKAGYGAGTPRQECKGHVHWAILFEATSRNWSDGSIIPMRKGGA